MDVLNLQRAASDERRSWEIWLGWVMYTTLGYCLIGAVTIAGFQFTPVGLLLIPVVGTLGMIVVGLLQCIVLRRYIREMRRRGWVLATVLGHFAGTIMAITVAVLLTPSISSMLGDVSGETLGVPAVQFADMLVAGAVLGTVIGFMQWLVLRLYLHAAAWWIPTNTVAGAIALGVSLISGLEVGLVWLTTILVSKVVTGVILGLITGIVLAWMLRKPMKMRS